MLSAVVSLIEKADETYDTSSRAAKEKPSGGKGSDVPSVVSGQTSGTNVAEEGDRTLASDTQPSAGASARGDQNLDNSGSSDVVNDGTNIEVLAAQTASSRPHTAVSIRDVPAPRNREHHMEEAALPSGGSDADTAVQTAIGTINADVDAPVRIDNQESQVADDACSTLASQCSQKAVLLERRERELRFSQQQVEREQASNREKATTIERLVAQLRHFKVGGCGAGTSTVSERALEEAQQEAAAALEELYREPVTHMETIVRFHSDTIAALEQSNATLRRQLLLEESQHESQVSSLRTELEQASFDTAKFTALMQESDKRREETARLVKKLGTLQALAARVQADLQAANAQNAKLQAALAARDGESETQQRTAASHTRHIESTALFHALDGKWWGAAVQQLLRVADVVFLRAERILRANALLRMFVVFYLLFMHVYLFHVVTSVVHEMPQNIGDSAQDHIEHHLHAKV